MSKRDKLVENFILKWIPFKRKEIQKELDSIIDSILTEAKAKSTVEPEVMANEVLAGGNFEDAYKYAMNVLEKYIAVTDEKAKKSHPDGNSIVHYRNKAQFMRTAKRTIEENIKAYFLLKDSQREP